MKVPFFNTQTEGCSMHGPAGRPRLWIRSGTQFGHCSGILGRGISRVLVETPAEVYLEAGLHLIVAPNGSGKTTFIRTLAGLRRPVAGNLEVSGAIHYISDQLQLDAELSPRSVFRAWFGGESLTFSYGLGEMLALDVSCQIRKLSRGNRQKVVLIVAETLAAASGTSVLFLDEPLAGMDVETRDVVAAYWGSTSSSMLRLVVLHELESVQKADSLFTLSRGQLRHTFNMTGSWTDTYRRLRRQ